MVRSIGVPGAPGPKDPGRFTAQNYSLPNLITMAYGIPHYRLSAEGLSFGIPLFDIETRMPVDTTKEQFGVMLQNLLKERFGLKVHWETRQLPMYDLVVAKNGPKLQEAEPDPPDPEGAQRRDPSWRMHLGPNGYPALPPGKSSTMAIMNGKGAMRGHLETAEQIAAKLSGQMGSPVNDATGLKGKYDYTVYWSAMSGRTAAAVPPGPDGAVRPPSEEDAGLPLTAAIQEQLGLKLESRKGPVEVLVVDHVDTKPTEN